MSEQKLTAQAQYCMDNLDNPEVKEYIREQDKKHYVQAFCSNRTDVQVLRTHREVKDILKPGEIKASSPGIYRTGDLVRILAADKPVLVMLRHSNIMHPNDFFIDFKPVMFAA